MTDENPRAVIGGNQPPLADVLAEETEAIRKRAEDLAAGAGRALVTDDETAGKATLLAGMILAHAKVIDAQRETTKAPYLAASRLIDSTFKNITSIMVEYDAKGRVAGGPLVFLTNQVDSYRRKKEAEAAEERRRLEEEARKQREAAEAAARAQREAEERERRAAEENARKLREAEAAAREAGNRAAIAKAEKARAEAAAVEAAAAAKRREDALASELAQAKANEAAAELERQASAVRATPIDSGLGVKAHGRKVFKATITDLTAALKHARKVDEASVRAAVQTIYDKQVRAGVRILPGAEVTEDSSTTFRSA